METILKLGTDGLNKIIEETRKNSTAQKIILFFFDKDNFFWGETVFSYRKESNDWENDLIKGYPIPDEKIFDEIITESKPETGPCDPNKTLIWVKIA